MKRFLLKLLILLLILLIVLAAVVFFGLSPLLNQTKPTIESKVSRLIKMETRVQGPIKISFFPRPEIRLMDIRIDRQNLEFINIKQINARFDRTLFQDNALNIERIELVQPKIVWRPKIDSKNVPPVEVERSRIFTLISQYIPKIERIHMGGIESRNGELRIFGKDTKEKLHVKKLSCAMVDLKLDDFSELKKGWKNIVIKHSFQATAEAQLLETPLIRLDDPLIMIHNNAGVMSFTLEKMKLGGGDSFGKMFINFNSLPVSYTFDYQADGVDLGDITNKAKPELGLKGRVSAIAHLKTRGSKSEEILSFLDGSFEMAATKLRVPNIDIDEVLANYAKSQDLDLFDIGAYVMGGPLGLLLTKSYDVSSLLTSGTGDTTSEVENLRFAVNLKRGVADLNDVAFSTKANRVAARGQFDIIQMTFNSVEVALLNGRGCAEFTETLNGPVKNPSIDSLSYIGKVLISPLKSLYNKVSKLVTDSCSPFYQGNVPHPAS